MELRGLRAPAFLGIRAAEPVAMRAEDARYMPSLDSATVEERAVRYGRASYASIVVEAGPSEGDNVARALAAHRRP
jgi:hypothetical protein